MTAGPADRPSGDDAAAMAERGLALLDRGRLQDAVACFQRVLAATPDDARTRLNLGTAWQGLGRTSEAAACFETALALKPDYAKAHLNLGTALLELDRPGEAAACFERALALAPDLAEAVLDLGIARERQGRLDEALACWHQALALRPNWLEARLNLGLAAIALGRWDQAAAELDHALAGNPGRAEVHMTLGMLLRHQNRLAEAEARLRRALALRPDYAEAHLNLGSTLQEQGRLDEALACFEHALAFKPDLAGAATAHLFTLLYRPGVTLAGIAAAAGAWNDRFAAPLKPAWPHPDPAARPERPRIGFVSGDFRSHAVGFLVLPALEALARAGHRFHCYANQREEDAVTLRFRSAASVWRTVSGWSDQALAERVSADGIDILFDLSGHTASNRLPVFARKPAPIQVSWVGWPATTGLEAMDYLLADPVQIPRGADGHYRERVVRLPEGYIAYQPFTPAPPPGPLPAEAHGAITFGSFNVLKKITPPVIETWSRLLLRVTDARLLMKAAALDCPETRRLYVDRFARHGIAAQRLVLLGGSSPEAHRQAIATADIALDSFPYSGGLTSLETLWMGVPVVTVPSDTLSSRHTLGYLSVIGLSQLAAPDPGRYVEIAADLAACPERLATVRARLRPHLAASPLCRPERFAAHFEQAITTMWQIFRAGLPPRSFDVAVHPDPDPDRDLPPFPIRVRP